MHAEPTRALHALSDISAAPPDPILGLTEAFKADPNPSKINLSVGVFQDETGRSPVLECVKQAEKRLLESESSKSYLPIAGDPVYGQQVVRLVFGESVADSKRIASIHTPGGTGALRVAGDFIRNLLGPRRVWLSDPTWPNHPGIFRAAHLVTEVYPYFEATTNSVAYESMREKLAHVPEGDVVVLHGCCHNPSGADLAQEQWSDLADTLRARSLVPLVDFAYQGFGDDLEADAAGVRTLFNAGLDMLVSSSFSKNFGLYRERVGTLSVVTESPDAAARVLSQLKAVVRTNYSNPPAHGGSIVATILSDAELTDLWKKELAVMQARIANTRKSFVEGLRKAGAKRDFSFLERQKGMFSFSGLNREQVERLRAEHSIYIVGSGRVNVAGITTANLEYLCNAIASVL